MFRLMCQNYIWVAPRASLLSHGNFFSTFSRRILEPRNNSDADSRTVSYLQNLCGLSLESAISASEKLHIDTTDKPDSILKLFRTHGLTQTQIKNLITNRPLLLLADLDNTLEPNLKLLKSLGFTGASLAKLLDRNHRILESDGKATVGLFRANGFTDNQIKNITMKRPCLYLLNAEKNLKPKLEFFKSFGFSELDMKRFLTKQPFILGRSLENRIIPNIQVLRRILDTDENVVKAIGAGYSVLEYDIEKELEPKIAILVNHGVPKSLVLKLILIQPMTLLQSTARLSEIIGEVKKLGFDPDNLLFVLAIRSMALMSKSLWDRKLEAYMSFGMTKDGIYSAFKKQPMCMLNSEKKIRKLMDFYVNKLSIEPLVISKSPNLLLFSLERRILPRCSVLQLLMLKEVLKGDVTLPPVLKMTEKQFTERFVIKYEHRVPEVVKAHQGKIKFKF